MTADHVPYRVFLSPERQKHVAAVVNGSLKRGTALLARKRGKIRNANRETYKSGRKKGKEKRKKREKNGGKRG